MWVRGLDYEDLPDFGPHAGIDVEVALGELGRNESQRECTAYSLSLLERNVPKAVVLAELLEPQDVIV